MKKIAYLKTNVAFLKYATMHPIGEDASTNEKILFMLWRILFFGTMSLIFSQSLMSVYMEKDDFVESSMGVIFVALFVSVLSRMVYYYSFGQKIRDLIVLINKKFVFATRNCEEEVTMQKADKNTTHFTYFWFCTILFTALSSDVIPFMMNKKKRVLPIQWYLYDWHESPNYEITVVLETVIEALASILLCAHDIFYVNVFLLTAKQFEVLGAQFRGTVHASLIDYGVASEEVWQFKKWNNIYPNFDRRHTFNTEDEKYERLLNILETAKFKQILDRNFKECIIHHQNLLDVCESIDDFFSPISMFIILTIIFYMIFAACVIILMSDRMLSIIFIMVTINGIQQLFLYHMFGQILTTAAEESRKAFHEMPWYLCDRQFCRMYNIVQAKINKPIFITAGKIIVMDLETYISILQACFSYFTVLVKMAEQKD